MTQKNQSRRNFLKKTGAAAGAIMGAPYFVPSSAFGANQRRQVAIIGSGGRGRSLMREFMDQQCDFVAVCDVFKPNLDEGVKIAAAGGKNPRTYEIYEDLLESNPDLDAIVIGSPEHSHCIHMTDSIEAGFDVFCEKPMSHSIEEGNWMVRKKNKFPDRILQVGMQRRSSPIVRKGKEVMDSGVIGDVNFVRVKWNWQYSSPLNNEPLPDGSLNWGKFCDPRRRVKYEPMKFRYWRYFWEFSGGNITDQGTHLMDVVQWYMGKEFEPVIPQSAVCTGEVYQMTGAKTPDVFSSSYQYDGFIVDWSLNYTSQYQNGWSIEFMGDKGTLVLDNKGFRVYEQVWEPDDNSDLESKKPPVMMESGALGSIEHVANFLECLETRKRPHAPAEIGHLAVVGPHLANVAFHANERAYLNPKATGSTTWDWWANLKYGL